MSKYVCKDCNVDFEQKSHYDRHRNKKIPCVLKDKPLKDVIKETVSKEVSKKLKETDKQIIVKHSKHSSSDDSDSESDSETEKSVKKSKSKKTKQLEKIDYSYLRLPTNEVIFELKEDKKNNNIKEILKVIDLAHSILFQAENIVGQKALQIIMSIIFIKLIQPYLSEKKEDGKIDLLDKKYYLDKFEDDENLDKILGYFKDLKTLAKQNLKTIRNDSNMDAIKQMGEILKRHPITKMIYTESNFIKVREASTIQTLINLILDKINFKDFENNEDAIGEIYEHMLNKYVKNDSKELGQYFTPRKLMKLILNFKNDRINQIFSKVKNIINIGDPCMGTGGWLVSSYNMFNQKYKNKINITGGEVEPDTFQYGLMNIILTQHKFPEDIHCNSSITHVNKNKNILITTNPPFNSKKQIKFDKIKENFENDKYTTDNNIKINDIFTLQKDDPPIQFLELDVYKLEDNGLCIIVLPYGEFFSGASFKATRKHFLEKVNITDIILVPSVFTHTDIKTCILVFEKNKDGTKEIKFSRINEDCNKITHITSVKIEDIQKEQVLSWYHTDYLSDKMIYDLSLKMTNFEWVEFGELFTLEKGKIQSSKVEEDEKGDSILINWSIYDKYKKISKYSCDGENIFISTSMPNGKNGGYMVIKYHNGKCDYVDLMSKININKKYIDKLNVKYIYYYLKSIQEHIEYTYEKGSCNKSLDQKNLNRIKIPIPPVDIQNKIITKLDSSNDKVKYMNLIMEQFKKDIDNYFELTLEIENKQPETKWIEFGEIFTLEKGQLQSSKVEEDENGILFVTGAKDENFKYIKKQSKSYLNGENIFISQNGNGNKRPIKYFKGECNYSDLLSVLHLNNLYTNKVNKKYIYYFLKKHQTHIEEYYQKGACNLSLDIKNFNRMKIQIPSIERQNKCIAHINNMEEIIKKWNSDVEEMTNNGSDKFLEYLEGESIKYSKDNKQNSESESSSSESEIEDVKSKKIPKKKLNKSK